MLILKYKITNTKEPAYLAELKLSLNGSSQVDFAIIHPSCKQNELILICQLNAGNSINQGDTLEFLLSVDMAQASGSNLVVNAEVSSSGSEIDNADNSIGHYVKLLEQSDVDVNG